MKEILKNVDFVDAIKKGKEISMKIFWGALHVCEKDAFYMYDKLESGQTVDILINKKTAKA